MKIRLTYEYNIPKEQDDWSIASLAAEAAWTLQKRLENHFYSSPANIFSKIEKTHGMWATDVTDEAQDG